MRPSTAVISIARRYIVVVVQCCSAVEKVGEFDRYRIQEADVPPALLLSDQKQRDNSPKR
jgi:hypothetical protein